MNMLHVRTRSLELTCEESGPAHGSPVILLHGWPDDVRTFDGITPTLHAKGLRTIAPWLRGFGPTRFLAPETPRSGQIAAMAQDVIDLADALGLQRFAVVGHDWGARIAYVLATVFPARITKIVTLSIGWTPGGFVTPSLDQARHYWYQWFMATERGADIVRTRGKELARFLWDTWSPAGWYDERAFDTTASSFDNPDWAEITLHSYRVRWGEAEPDLSCSGIEAQAKSARSIATPTLMLHGASDRATLTASSEGQHAHFTGYYQRRVLEGIGHFPTREAPDEVARIVVDFLTTRHRCAE